VTTAAHGEATIELRAYQGSDWRKVAALFNDVFASRYRFLCRAVEAGYLRDRLQQMLNDGVAAGAWVAAAGSRIAGFVSAHAGDSPQGAITTPVFGPTDGEAGELLLARAEQFLHERGMESARVVGITREYGIGFGEPLHMWLLNRGYQDCDAEDIEVAMEIDLARLAAEPAVEEFRSRNEADGLIFEFLQQRHVESFKELAHADWMRGGLGTPLPDQPDRRPYAVCRDGDEVIGFCGGCHVEPAYRTGGWAFILLKGWTRQLDGKYYHRGIGAVLLSMANAWLRDRGAEVQVLFTGIENPAQRLYRKAGYRYCFIGARDVRKSLAAG
jgi:GNAT superfamily N-acetyltransferase